MGNSIKKITKILQPEVAIIMNHAYDGQTE
jgi:hypothetical protein